MEFVYILLGGPWTMNILKVTDPNGGKHILWDSRMNYFSIEEDISPLFLWNSDEQCFWGFNPKIPGVYEITVCIKKPDILHDNRYRLTHSMMFASHWYTDREDQSIREKYLMLLRYNLSSKCPPFLLIPPILQVFSGFIQHYNYLDTPKPYAVYGG